MALDYSVDIKIDAKYDRETIKALLTAGKRKGFIYRKFEPGKLDLSLPDLSVEEGLEAIFTSLRENSMACLFLQVENTYLTMHFLDFGNLGIMFSGLSDNWSKIFIGDIEDIDVARYAKALLDMVADFRILEMHIEKD